MTLHVGVGTAKPLGSNFLLVSLVASRKMKKITQKLFSHKTMVFKFNMNISHSLFGGEVELIQTLPVLTPPLCRTPSLLPAPPPATLAPLSMEIMFYGTKTKLN